MAGAARGTAIAYVRKSRVEIGAPLSFDREYPHVTALELMLAAVAGDLVVGMKILARERRVTLENVEAVVQGELRSPLVYLGVVGEEGDPGLSSLFVKVYLDSPAERDAVMRVWDEVRKRSPILNTLGSAVRVDLEVRLT